MFFKVFLETFNKIYQYSILLKRIMYFVNGFNLTKNNLLRFLLEIVETDFA